MHTLYQHGAHTAPAKIVKAMKANPNLRLSPATKRAGYWVLTDGVSCCDRTGMPLAWLAEPTTRGHRWQSVTVERLRQSRWLVGPPRGPLRLAEMDGAKASSDAPAGRIGPGNG